MHCKGPDKSAQTIPGQVQQGHGPPLATWRNGATIPSAHVTALLRAAVFKQGNNVHLFSRHALREGGDRAIQATNDIDMVARFARW